MAKKKRKMPGLNTTSTADISFMLLIFFLITTSMDTDQGLARTLPRPPEDENQKKEIDVQERNILRIRVNKSGEVLINDKEILQPHRRSDGTMGVDKRYITDKAKEFVKNENGREDLPRLYEKQIDLLGRCFVTDKHVISVQTDRMTKYGVYFEIQDALVTAYNELRDELCKEKFGHGYKFATDEERDACRKYYPQKISEAEPKQVGGLK